MKKVIYIEKAELEETKKSFLHKIKTNYPNFNIIYDNVDDVIYFDEDNGYMLFNYQNKFIQVDFAKTIFGNYEVFADFKCGKTEIKDDKLRLYFVELLAKDPLDLCETGMYSQKVDIINILVNKNLNMCSCVLTIRYWFLLCSIHSSVIDCAKDFELVNILSNYKFSLDRTNTEELEKLLFNSTEKDVINEIKKIKEEIKSYDSDFTTFDDWDIYNEKNDKINHPSGDCGGYIKYISHSGMVISIYIKKIDNDIFEYNVIKTQHNIDTINEYLIKDLMYKLVGDGRDNDLCEISNMLINNKKDIPYLLHLLDDYSLI